MNGIIIVNKEAGISSFGVCSALRKITDEKKTGHTGTLDPMACGVLVVTCGKATRIANYLKDDIKEYIAGIKFGVTTDTLDIWGTVLSETKPDFTQEAFLNALETFKGDIIQTTPAYSAVRVDGKHLYEYARKGKTAELPQRNVTVLELELLEKDLPHSAVIRVKCSKGTYIRSLCDDIGKMLGCGAVMQSLTRTYACGYKIEEAHTLGEIGEMMQKGDTDRFLLDCGSALSYMPKIEVKPSAGKKLLCGNAISCEECFEPKPLEEGSLTRLYLNGEFVAVASVQNGGYKPDKLFV